MKKDLIGQIDAVTNNNIKGWAAYKNNTRKSVVLKVYADDQLIMTFRSNAYRKDLKEAGIGTGKFAFDQDLPPAAFLASKIEVKDSEMMENIENSPFSISLNLDEPESFPLNGSNIFWCLTKMKDLINKNHSVKTKNKKSLKTQNSNLSLRQAREMYEIFLRRTPTKNDINSIINQSFTTAAKALVDSIEFEERFPNLKKLDTVGRVTYMILTNHNDLRINYIKSSPFHGKLYKKICENAENFLIPPKTCNKLTICMTSRGRGSLSLSIASLLNQKRIDDSDFSVKIILIIPEKNAISEDQISVLKNLNEVDIYYHKDIGPISKLIYPLKYMGEEEIFALADDDIVYPRYHFSVLLSNFLSLGGGVAVGTSGFNWIGELRRAFDKDSISGSYLSVEGNFDEVDVIETWCGVILSKKWFQEDFERYCKNISILNSDAGRTDDTIYSAYLDFMGICKVNINNFLCNRYDVGFNNRKNDFISKFNENDDSLNGNGPVSNQWIRFFDHAFEIQRTIPMNLTKNVKKKESVAILTVCVGEEYIRKTGSGKKSKLFYCESHGYDYIEYNESLRSDLPLIWSKIEAINITLNKEYDYVAYLDADVVITNPSKSILSIFERAEGEILFCYDLNGPNIGNILIKNTERTKKIFREIIEMESFHFNSPWYEQAAFICYMTDNKEARDLIEGFPQNLFNSYLYTWKTNDLLVHFAGVYGPILGSIMDLTFDIVYGHESFDKSSHFRMLPFFQNMLPDPNREQHLREKRGESDVDLYLDVNNSCGERQSYIFVVSSSSSFQSFVGRLLLGCDSFLFWNCNFNEPGWSWEKEAARVSAWPSSGKKVVIQLVGGFPEIDRIFEAFSVIGEVRVIFEHAGPLVLFESVAAVERDPFNLHGSPFYVHRERIFYFDRERLFSSVGTLVGDLAGFVGDGTIIDSSVDLEGSKFQFSLIDRHRSSVRFKKRGFE